MSISPSSRAAKQQQGMAAWQGWMVKNQASVIEGGGPLGKTKRVSKKGIEDTSNALAAFALVRAESHEAAAKLFENHAHFSIFPGDAIEIMPVMPIPGR